MKKLIEQRFSVPFHYNIHFTENIFDFANPVFAEVLGKNGAKKVFFVIDQGVLENHPQLISDIKSYAGIHEDHFILCAEPLIVPGGEGVKNEIRYVEQILEASNTYGIDRHSFIVAIGGGAVLDMAGFATAIAHRGIRHIRIPTTVLSQNDSGIGVKNSVNAFGKKNFLGTFAPPYSVINDNTFLLTLEDRDWLSGISEAIKVALIKDAPFFEWLEDNSASLSKREMAPMKELIFRCAQMHLDHISGGDPFESGSSRPLDFGHWAAHKLEHLTDFRIKHGEAVAIGIALDSYYSFLKGILSRSEIDRILSLFQQLGFEVHIPELSGKNLMEGLEEFREHLGGELTIMLLQSIGRGKEVHEIDQNLMAEAAEELKKIQEKG